MSTFPLQPYSCCISFYVCYFWEVILHFKQICHTGSIFKNIHAVSEQCPIRAHRNQHVLWTQPYSHTFHSGVMPALQGLQTLFFPPVCNSLNNSGWLLDATSLPNEKSAPPTPPCLPLWSKASSSFNKKLAWRCPSLVQSRLGLWLISFILFNQHTTSTLVINFI